MKLGLLKNKKEKLLLGLDTGTEAVKAALFLDKGAGGCKILGYSSCYYEKYGVFNTREFFKDLFKNTVSKAVRGAQENVALSEVPLDLKKRVSKTNWEVVLTFSPEYLKARIVEVCFKRKNRNVSISKKEKTNIKENILFQARKRISDQFAREAGILPAEIEWLSFKVLENKVDGYRVADLKDHKGERLGFKIMVVFSPQHYLRRIRNILEELNFNIIGIVHLAEIIVPEEAGLFLDMGGTVSQGICFKGGAVKEVFEFYKGGRDFTETLSQDLGIDETTARNFKERYSLGDLGKGAEKKVKSIFAQLRRDWYNSLRDKVNLVDLVPSGINFVGGGALLPDIGNVLKENLAAEFQKSSFSYSLKTKMIHPADLKNGLEILTKNLNSIQATPLLYICSNFKNE